MHNISVIEIADIRVALEINDPAFAALVRERYAEFIIAHERPHTLVRVTVNAGSRLKVWTSETYLDGNHLIYRADYDAAWVNLDRGYGLLELTPESNVENFLRALYAYLGARSGALLLHAAGIVKDRAGYVFFGASARDKLTMAQWSREQGCTMLSDDLVMLKKTDAAVRVFGAPFREGAQTNAPHLNHSARVAGEYALAPSARHRLAALAPADAIARLATAAPFTQNDPTHARCVTELCADLVARIPVRELHLRDAGVWKVMNEVV